MVTKTFFRKVEGLQKDLERKITDLYDSQQDRIISFEMILFQIDESIRELKKLLKAVTFGSIADEILFFKKYKPYFISHYIYFSKALQLETSKPPVGHGTLKKFLQSELSQLKKDFSEDPDFYNYYRRNATYLDYKYFTRKSNDLKMKQSLNLYDLDEEFTTSQDFKISLLKANEMFYNYLLEEIDNIEKPKEVSNISKTKISWTSSKVSLLEILYALHLSQCFNSGNIDFIDIVREVEKNLSVNLGNFYKTLGEIKNRKYNRTKFLQLLTDNLNKSILENER